MKWIYYKWYPVSNNVFVNAIIYRYFIIEWYLNFLNYIRILVGQTFFFIRSATASRIKGGYRNISTGERVDQSSRGMKYHHFPSVHKTRGTLKDSFSSSSFSTVSRKFADDSHKMGDISQPGSTGRSDEYFASFSFWGKKGGKWAANRDV